MTKRYGKLENKADMINNKIYSQWEVKQMRISTQTDNAFQISKTSINKSNVEIPKAVAHQTETKEFAPALEENKDGLSVTKEKLEEAVSSINEFLSTQNKASKFIFHEGLNKYYVQLVDAETEEVIKEIPPQQLLNAFYEMKKLAGMIIDEKI